jgi:hypothetical protein
MIVMYDRCDGKAIKIKIVRKIRSVCVWGGVVKNLYVLRKKWRWGAAVQVNGKHTTSVYVRQPFIIFGFAISLWSCVSASLYTFMANVPTHCFAHIVSLKSFMLIDMRPMRTHSAL